MTVEDEAALQCAFRRSGAESALHAVWAASESESELSLVPGQLSLLDTCAARVICASTPETPPGFIIELEGHRIS